MNENQNPEVRNADEDVEGHKRPLFGAEADETDDVSGHVQPRRDLDIER